MRRPLKDLEVHYMLRGYFYAGTAIRDTDALGGFAPSSNLPRSIGSGVGVGPGRISLVALPDAEIPFARRYRGMIVRLVNTTNEQLAFTAADSRLSIIQEAIDRDGVWKPIEYLPSSWCGNSYHRVFLGARQYWEFAAARYTGAFRTQLRFRLDVWRSADSVTTIFSNVFDGSVNERQFTVKQGHTPRGLADPYYD